MADVGIKIKATDEASGVFGKVAAEAGKLQGAISATGSSFAALGSAAVAGLSVISFSTKIKDAIDMADSFNKLSQKTGVAVEELSKLNYAASLSDVSTESLQKGLRKLNMSISEAAGGSKEKIAVFQALGVAFKDSSGQALKADVVFKDLSEKMSQSADGANKVTVGSNLMGKGFEELIPLVNSGKDGLQGMGDEAQKLGVVMGADFAKNAEEFNDNLAKMQLAGQGLFVTLGTDLVKALGDAAKEMANATVEGGALHGVLTGLHTLFFGTDQHKNDKALVEQTEILLNLEKSLTQQRAAGYSDDSRVVTNTLKQIAGIKEQLAITQNYRKVLQGVADDKEKNDKKPPAKDSAGVVAAAKVLGSGSGASVQSEYQRINAELSKQADLTDAAISAGRELTETEKYRIESIDKITAAYINGKISAQEWVDASTKAIGIADNKDALAATQRQAKSDLEAAKARQTYNEYLDKGLISLQDENQSLQDNIDRMGLSKEAIAELDAIKLEGQAIAQDLIVFKKMEKGVDEEHLQIYKDIAAELRKQAALKRTGAAKETQVDAAEAATEAWQKSWEDTDRLARDAFTGWAENGTSAAEAIGKSLKKALLSAIYEATIRPLAFQLYTSIAGGAAGAAGGSALGSAGAGAAGSYLGNMAFAGSTLGAATGAVGTGFMATMTGSSVAGASAAYSAAGMSGVSAGLTIGAAMPYVLAAMAVASAIENRPESSANLGDSSATYGSNGARLALETTNGLNKDTTSLTEALQKSYVGAAKSLGIALAETNYNVNVNNGADAKNPNTIIDSTVNGVRFSSGEVSQKDSAGLQLAASRAVLSALQASDMPAYMATVLNGVTASTATQEQINSTLAYAQSLKTVREAMLETRTATQIMQDTVAKGFADMGTSAATFKADFVTAIDAGLTPENFNNWNTLKATMDALADSAKSASDSIESEIRRIRGLSSTSTTYAGAQSAFAISSAQARAGDLTAAAALPALSSAMLALAKNSVRTSAELRYIEATTANSLQATLGAISSAFGTTMPSFAVGTDFVPRDMVARIHKGERITPAEFNPTRGGGSGNDALAAEVKDMKDKLAAVLERISAESRATAIGVSDTNRKLDRVMPDGDALATRVAA